MTTWNPKVEKLVREMSDAIYTLTRYQTDPSISAAKGFIGNTFLWSSGKTKKIAKNLRQESGVAFDDNCFSKDFFEQIITLAEQNNSDAADKVKRAREVWKKLSPEVQQTKNENLCLKRNHIYKKAAAAKGIQF